MVQEEGIAQLLKDVINAFSQRVRIYPGPGIKIISDETVAKFIIKSSLLLEIIETG